jgi:hypothetical protein
MAVAPTQQGEKSYSDMVNEQIGLIQRQRAANLNQRLAQEEKNREFRTKQYQNIYDFDVSGLAGGDVELLGKLQKQLASGLNPDSDQSYSNSQELVADIAYINNVYNEMKRWGETGMSGRQSYQQGILQPDRGDGTVFVGTEDTLSARNAAWEQGAFANAQILGGPGQRQIIGDMLDQDGNVMKQGIDFFQNEWRSRPDMFWRPEIGEGAKLLDGVALDFSSRKGVDSSNVQKVAAELFDSDPATINRIRRESLRQINQERADIGYEPISMDAAESTFDSLGLGVNELRQQYVDRAVEGIGLRPKAAGPQTFSGTVYDTQSGARAIGLTKPIEVVSSTLSGDVSHIALLDDEMVVVYEDADGERQEQAVREGSDAWDSIVAQSGGLDALAKMVTNKNTVSDNQPQGQGSPSGEGATSGEDGKTAEEKINELDKQITDDTARLNELESQPRKNNQALREIESLKQKLKKAEDEKSILNEMDPVDAEINELQREIASLERQPEENRSGFTKSRINQLKEEVIQLTESKPEPEPVNPEPSFKTEKGETYTADQLEPNLEDWEKSLRAGDKGVKSGVAVIAKNFGNLRPNPANPYRSGVYEVSSDNKYQNFSSYEDGLKGLIWDIKSKQHKDGLSSNVVSKGDSIMQAIKEYAPAADKNNPESYAKFVVDFVNEQTGGSFTVDSKASELPTQFLVEAIIMKEDISLYNEMKDRGFFGNKIAGYSQGISKNNLV